tara:strand:- start:2088 stop:2384 length:297 start_codon:yes stop_codon:yes gene_type:complete
MLAFAPGTSCVALPTTIETASEIGERLDYVRLVNESSSVQTVTTVTSADDPVVMGSIRLQPGEVMILWKRREFHKMYASSAEVYGTGGMVRPAGLQRP